MRKIFYAAILILFCAIDAHAQNAAFGDTVFGPNIAIKPGAFVTICSHPSTVASCPANKITLYSDVGGSPVTNPLTTDGEGHWLAYAPSGTYDYIVTGTGITPMTVPFTFSIGGSGGACSTVLQTNGTPNTDQCLLNLHAGTNITLSNTAGTTTISATGGGTGCTLPGNDTGVLSEHPDGTCYNSDDYTWDDDSTRNFLTAGDGSNNPPNHPLTTQLTFEEGTGNGITSDTNITDGNLSNVFFRGRGNTISATDVGVLGASVYDIHAYGRDNAFSAATGGSLSELGAINRGNSFTVNTQGSIDDSLLAGVTNSMLSVGNGSNSSSFYGIGEGNEENSSAGGDAADNFAFGEVIHFLSQTTGSSSLLGDTAVGFHITMTSSSGHAMSNVFAHGETIAATSSSGNVNDVSLIGDHLSATDCNNSYLFGKNIACSGQTGFVGIGLSSTPEIGVTSGLATLNAPLAVIVPNAGSTGTTLNKLAKLTGAPSTAVITATSDVTGAAGIVSFGAGTTGNASISKLGITLCIFDGATTAGDYVNISTSTAGDCHDAGASQPLYSVGRVMSTNGGGGTYPVDLIIGSGTGGAIATQGKVALTGQTASLSPTALITTPASPALAAYRVTTALSCDSSSASATVTFTLAWTDPSNTSQSTTSSAATCTTLGSASYQSLSYAINVKEGTAINYSTTIANTPTYSLHVLLEGAW